MTVKELDNVGWGRGVDDRGGNELVHGLVVRWLSWVVNKAGAADVDSTRKESHTKRLLMRNALESANEVSTLEILVKSS